MGKICSIVLPTFITGGIAEVNDLGYRGPGAVAAVADHG